MATVEALTIVANVFYLRRKVYQDKLELEGGGF